MVEGFADSILVRWLVWCVLIFLAGQGIRLGNAQLRRHAQPFDHTLIIAADGVTRIDNLRKRSDEFLWSEVRRVRLDSETFEMGFGESRQGETYLLARSKLSKREEAFLAQRLLEQ